MLGHEVPLDRILFLTLTCRPGTTDVDANEEYSAITRHLNKLFPGGWVRVLSYTQAGVPHIHAIVVAAEDVRTGFDFDAYREIRELDACSASLDNEALCRRRYLQKHLTTNAHLIALTAKVKDLLRRRAEQRENGRVGGIFAPRFELVPIIRNMTAMGKYLAENIEKAADNVATRSKGIRLIAYSRNFPKCPAYALPATRRSLRWHERLRWVISGLRMPPGYMKERFGPKWAFYITQYVFNPLEQEYGRDLENWPDYREVGKMAMEVLESKDRWGKYGRPKEVIEWLQLHGRGPIDCMEYMAPLPEWLTESEPR